MNELYSNLEARKEWLEKQLAAVNTLLGGESSVEAEKEKSLCHCGRPAGHTGRHKKKVKLLPGVSI